MNTSNKQSTRFLFTTRVVGVIFVAIYLTAYLGGLPGTTVLHSEPIFRIPLAVFGETLLVFIFTAFGLAISRRKE